MVLIDTLLVFISLILIFDYNEGQFQVKFTDEKRLHVPKELSNAELKELADLNDKRYFHYILNNTLVPRVVGSDSHEKVKELIGSELRDLSWDVEYDSFRRQTPNLGKLRFTNVIARLDPTAPRYLLLACHYDSKYFEDIEFVGAIDSAVPCAMLLHLAKVLTPYLPQSDSRQRVSLMLVFFDGEEAFEHWSDTDSLYGARNLADKWSNTLYTTREENLTYLHRIDMLMLLDLIGTRDTVFYNFFSETVRWHKALVDIESRMRAKGLLYSNQTRHFDERSALGYIEDDHIPFLIRGVPVLHLIPTRFPQIWHTEGDNYSALHFPTIESISKILSAFVYSYLNGSTGLK